MVTFRAICCIHCSFGWTVIPAMSTLRGAVRYEEVDEAGRPVITRKVGTVYIRKSALAGRRYPDVLEITMISR